MKPLTYMREKLLGGHLDFRVRLFNVLALAGTLVSFTLAVLGMILQTGAVNVLTNFVTAALSAALLVYATKSGRYQITYLITIAGIFLILFPVLFFSAGGNHSGMPSFFVFAVLFTIFMLEGKAAVVMSALELALYTGIMLLAYRRPQLVNAFATEAETVTDIWLGMLVVSVSVGVCMFLHFRLYNRQQRELEAAREEALGLSEAKSRFLANMSHEIRTPINIILGMNEMVARESESEQVRGYAGRIETAGKSLLLLINNILDISKIESGNPAAVNEPYRTAELIDGLFLTGTELAQQRGLQFAGEVDETLPRALTGDVLRIRQIVANFLSNAAKYTPEGGITLSFGQKKREDGILLCVSVSDTGIGIREENTASLFDAFTRADLPGGPNVEGTGLGLAIAKAFAELLDGKIHVQSVWGRGSTFSVEIPQKISDPVPVGHQRERAEGEHDGGFIAPEGSILVVDDNEENLQVTKALLARTMLRVDTVTGGAACLEAVQNFRYHVILLDYMMPEMDGLETLRCMKAIPGFDTPVIALTADVTAGTKEKLSKAGFGRYLFKPVTHRDLEATLRSFLPRELITDKGIKREAGLPLQLKHELARGLKPYGVFLADGLRYLDGDLRQFGKMAEFFTGHYPSQQASAVRFAQTGELENLGHLAHALKSRAKAVGAAELADTAAKLERLCGEEANGQIPLLMPILFYEWERARDGLAVLAAGLDAAAPGAEDPGLPEAPLPTRSQLLLCLRQNRRPDALDGLDRLIAAAETKGGEGDIARLREIRELVAVRSFRQAERLYSAFGGGDGDEP